MYRFVDSLQNESVVFIIFWTSKNVVVQIVLFDSIFILPPEKLSIVI